MDNKRYTTSTPTKLNLKKQMVIINRQNIKLQQMISENSYKEYRIFYNLDLFNIDNDLPYIDVYNDKTGTIVQFLINTASEQCIIKHYLISDNNDMDSTRRIYLRDISGKSILSLGTTEVNLFDSTITFHVVPDEFPISCEGIIGLEFLGDLKAIINFKNKGLRLLNKATPFRKRNIKPMTFDVPRNDDTDTESLCSSTNDFHVENPNHQLDLEIENLNLDFENVNVVTRAQKRIQEKENIKINTEIPIVENVPNLEKETVETIGPEMAQETSQNSSQSVKKVTSYPKRDLPKLNYFESEEESDDDVEGQARALSHKLSPISLNNKHNRIQNVSDIPEFMNNINISE